MKKVLALIIAMTLSGASFAQRNSRSVELSAEAGFGVHTLNFQTSEDLEKSFGLGAQIKGMGRYMFSKYFGVGAGLRFSHYSVNTEFNYTQEIADAYDSDNKQYTHRTIFSDYQEELDIYTIGVPVELIIQYAISNQVAICGGLGMLPEYAFGSKLKVIPGNMETRAYYPEYDLEVFGVESHHLGNTNYTKDSYDFNLTYSAMAEFGIKYKVASKMYAFAQAYVTYGLKPIINSNDNYLFDPDCGESGSYQNPVYNGILQSRLTTNVTPISFGLSVGISMKLN